MSLKISLCARPGTHQDAAVKLFAKGLAKHGLACMSYASSPPPSDLTVVWGVRHRPAVLTQKQSGGRLLVMERAYLGDRFQWMSLGYDGLNGFADFCNDNVPSDRAKEYWPKLLQTQTTRNGPAVIMGQVPGDASLRGMVFADWANIMVRKLKARGWPVVFRPHPLKMPEHKVECPYIDGSLPDVLAQARLVVTYNSNSGVDAVVAGVPTVAVDRGSMVWGLASADVPAQSSPSSPSELERQRWLEKIAYCQWLPDEIASGAAWDHLKQGLASV
jgi:hypothetical protein